MIRGSEDQKLALSFSMVAGKEATGLKLEDFQHLARSPSCLMTQKRPFLAAFASKKI